MNCTLSSLPQDRPYWAIIVLQESNVSVFLKPIIGEIAFKKLIHKKWSDAELVIPIYDYPRRIREIVLQYKRSGTVPDWVKSIA